MECTYLDRASFAIEYVIRVQLRLVHKASFATKKNDQSSIILTPKEDFLELSMNEMNNTRSPGLPRLYRVVSSPVSPDEALSVALRIIHAESFVFDFSFEAQSNSSLANEVSGKENSKPRVSLDSKANHELLALSSIPLPPANSELLEYNLQNVAHTLDDVGVQGSRGTLNLREFSENESDGGSEGGNLVIMSPLARRSTGNFVPETFTNVDSKSHKCPTEETECTSRVHSKSAALGVLEEGPVWLEMYTPSIAECLAILGDARGNKSVITQLETILSCLSDTCSVEDIHIGNHLDGFLIHFDSNCLFLTRGQSLVIRFHPATTNSTSIPQRNQQEEVLKTTLEAPILADETSRKQTARNKQAGETNQRLRCLSPASRHHRHYRTDNRYRLWYNNNSVREIISRLRTECRRLDALYSPVQDSSSQPFSLEDGRRPLMQPNKDLRLEIKTELADVPLRHDLCATGSKSIFHISSCVISCILSHLYIHRGVERSRDLIQRMSALEEIVLVLESNEKMDILRRLSHLRRELSAERQAITRCNLVVRNLARCQILTSSDMDRLKSDIQRLIHTYSMVIDTLSSINGNFNAFQSSCMEQHAHSTTTFMQHLTCMTSLMLPLSFVTALLGMNVRVPWQTEIVDDPSAEENQKFLSPRAFIIIMLLSLGYIIVTVLLYIISQTWALREQREICMTGLEDDRIVSPKKSNLTFSSVSAYRRRRDFELAKSHSSRFKSVSFGLKH